MVRSTVVLVAALVVAACVGEAIDASGSIVSEPREAGTFSRVDASQGVSVRITVDPAAAHSITVVYDDNLIDDVTTDVSGGTLRARLDAEVSLSGGGQRYVEVVTPALDGIEASSGANVAATGTAAGLEVEASGGANVDLGAVDAERVSVDASGGANVLVSATASVTGTASGGANLTILGDPGTVDVDSSGGANVIRR